MSPDHYSQAHQNPFGAYTQQAQNWENERLAAIRRENDRLDFQRMQAEEQRQIQQARREQEQQARRQREAQKAQATQQRPSPQKTNSASSSNQVSFKDVITVITFIVATIFFYGVFDEHLIGGAIAGAIAAAIIRHTYKFLIAAAVIIFLITLFAQS